MRVLIGLFLIFFLPSPSMGQSDYGEYGGAILVNIYDAKTLLMDLPEYPSLIGEKITVKINGIETPKLKANVKKNLDLQTRQKNLPKKL